ncbi:MAG: PQQ-binding-like beta-propeller repeat protein [Ignavibacteria bacterium]|nr:PQQ-binding-like beta-propeller repeat protein [Ignavibacteria bacterium]
MKVKVFFAVIVYLILSNFSYGQNILWWFDTFDSCFGQSAGGDIDGDGKLELIFGCYRNDSSIYALNAEDGSLLWKVNTSVKGFEGCNDVAPLLYDITGDEIPEVIVPSSCNPKTFCFDGKDGKVIWETQTRGSDSPPTIGDIDGDGKLEILHGEFNGYLLCIDARTGERKWEILVQKNTWIQTAPTLVDLDDDMLSDIVVATWALSKDDTNRVYAFRGKDLRLLWKKDIGGTVYHGTGVLHLNNDLTPDLLVGDYTGTLYAINGKTGETLWTLHDSRFHYIGSPVSIGDLDGDANCDLVFTSAFDVVALTKGGIQKWKYTILQGTFSFRGVVLSDLTGDNLPEVICATTNGKVIVLEGKNGKLLHSIDLQEHIGKALSIDNCPIIADFNGDDVLDIFVVGGYTLYPDFSKNYGRAYAISISKGLGPNWLMFQNNPNRNGSICQTPLSIPESHQDKAYTFELENLPDQIKLHFKSDLQNITENSITIFNIFGQVVSQKLYTLRFGRDYIMFDVSLLPKGLYNIRFTLGEKFSNALFTRW